MADVILKGISKSFGAQRVVNDLSLTVADGEFLSLLGPSGCGKSTVLRMISGLEDIDTGELYIGGKRYNDIPARNRGIAMVFQSYALFPHMTVAENLAFGLRIRKMPKPAAAQKIGWAIELTNLQGLEKRYPRELSGGQRQRVALGRALVLDPQVLLLDEPLSNLDAALRDRMTAELKRLHRQIGKTIIYVTHNQIEAMTLSNRIALMREGELVQSGPPNDLYNAPRSEFVAGFIGNPPINIFEAEVDEEDGTVRLVFEGARLKVDQSTSNHLRPHCGKTIQVGLRPQHIYHHLAKVGRRHSDTQITVEVDLVEALGDKNLVMGKIGKTALVFLVDPDFAIDSGQTIPVVVDGRKLHFFDPKTKESLVEEGGRPCI